MLIRRAVLLGMMLALLLSAGLAMGQGDDAQPFTFHFGVDLSYVNEMDDCGAVYRENGQLKDAFALFAEHGAGLVRARLWHDPDWTEYSTLTDVTRTFRRAQEADRLTLLDFHYSDNWADPGRQEIPAAWLGLDDSELAEAIYQYTYNVLMSLHAEGLMPAFVQVGNETNGGMLKQAVGLDWARDAGLFNAGIQAVRDAATETNTSPQIILHIAQPENTTEWFDGAISAGVTDFDVIGVSYYPQWSTFSISDMGGHVSYLRGRFGKDVMIVETAYAWTREGVAESANNILNQGVRGYPFTPAGQRQFMTDLTQSLISNGALGVVYWEPAWVSTECFTRWGQGSHWENATFFDFQNENEVHEGIEFLSHPYTYPSHLVDGLIQDEYGAALVEDERGDALEDRAALDWLSLYHFNDTESFYLALTIDGDIYSERNNYLIYFDTTHDEQGANVDVGSRPITVADPFKPEFRLDIGIMERRGTVSGSYTFYAWIDSEEAWQPLTFVGGVAIQANSPSVIEIQIPKWLLGEPELVYIGAVSTNQTRLHTAADILGSDFTPSEWTEGVVIDAFFPLGFFSIE